ncbi:MULTISPECIES: potassium-transporting ATPase subunit KdpC [Paenibacillus]|uniref:potassium-transporting ATPase subunit KdpC n=1 Tax=Paenibacillus TaxID=44249 RepID=UPI0002E4868F|nr:MULTISPECIES: potassium-transporting ATPase subunit KdpC [Paenibacillus]KKD55600.1 potassium transporter TrkA [Paenibacillus sp. ICGEB2008]MEE4577942.1 potassium-transporting ATPase subunit KdpC [Paenibacillus polymyxa]RGL34074.1 potassium-transporting ATPase subunit KdpC [Paenibacillus polymyxa]UMR37038.1 potassium-transporting ATPase subunit KdpC [Paenibacillus polymyxa]
MSGFYRMLSGRRFAAHEKAGSGGQDHNKRTGTEAVPENQPERQEMRGSTVIGVALRTSVLMILLCGLAYPLVSTGVAQVLFPRQANGSMLRDTGGRVVGSELIGQSFANPAFFQGRVSSIDYNGAGSGSSNYAPSNPALVQRIKESIADWQKHNPDVPVSQVPLDLITNSGSGLDPHISPQAAQAQIPRISGLTGISQDQLKALVQEQTEGRSAGVFGEPRVNVLKLNLALEALMKVKPVKP